MSLRPAGGWKPASAPIFTPKAKGESTFWSSRSLPVATEHPWLSVSLTRRLRVLQGHYIQPGEQSPAGAMGQNQALAAMCHPGAADDPLSCCHMSPVIARSPGGPMPHSTAEAGTPASGALVTVHQGRGTAVPGQTEPSSAEGCPKGVTLSPLLAASALQGPRTYLAAAAPVPCTTTPGGVYTQHPFPFHCLQLQGGGSPGL